MPTASNSLYYGDILDILRRYIADSLPNRPENARRPKSRRSMARGTGTMRRQPHIKRSWKRAGRSHRQCLPSAASAAACSRCAMNETLPYAKGAGGFCRNR